jgi:uncharacterized membrane protein YqiK
MTTTRKILVALIGIVLVIYLIFLTMANEIFCGKNRILVREAFGFSFFCVREP